MNYYNDHDPNACAWIQGLIDAELIPPGDVDSRSILEITPDELKGYGQCHFFCGIAGWPLALALAGVATDVQLWSGSCPCQPLSCAGKGLGEADERHLWPAWAGLIRECRPPVVIGEQVASKDGREWFAGVRLDLESLGYAVGGSDLCSAGCGSPNIRQRLFWVADSQRNGWNGSGIGGESGRGQSSNSRPTDGLADLFGAGLQGQSGDERDRNQPGRIGTEPLGSTAERGEPVRLADAESQRERPITRSTREGVLLAEGDGGARGMGQPDSAGRQPGELAATTAGHGDTTQPAGINIGGMGNTTGRGCGVSGNAPLAQHGGYPIRPSWSGYQAIPCRDGKFRRIPTPVEPGFLRMAHGIPEGVDLDWILGAFPLCQKVKGRTALLRGFGNAINPVVAAEFIQAFMEARNQ